MTHLLQLVLALGIIILASKLAGAASKLIGQPAVFGELLAGLILGPTAVNLLHLAPFAAAPGSEGILVTIKDTAEIGVIFLMYLAGLETDLKEMRKVGLAAFSGAAGGVILPFAAGTGLSLAFGYPVFEGVFIGTILTATSVSISAQTLMELGQLRSKEGSIILGAAVIDDVMGIIVLSLVVALHGAAGAPGGSGEAGIAWIVAKLVLFFIGSVALGSLVLDKLTRWMEKLPGSEILLAFALAVGLFFAWAAEHLGGVAAITGSYLAGVLYGQTRFKHEIEEKLKVICYGFFVPVFFVSIGLEADAGALGGSVLFTALIVAVAIVTKVIGSGLGVKLTGFGFIESVRVGIGMISRGEVALIVAGIGLANKVINTEIFSIMVMMTLATTLITPVLLKMAFPRQNDGPAAGA